MKKKHSYSPAERRAYNIGLGAGLCGVSLNDDRAVNLVDSKQGLGQDEQLVSSCRKGMIKGFNQRNSMVPFENYNSVKKK